MNTKRQYASKEYKPCAGKGCQKLGIHFLKILFLNKNGWFCDTCKSTLIAENLVIGDDTIREVNV